MRHLVGRALCLIRSVARSAPRVRGTDPDFRAFQRLVADGVVEIGHGSYGTPKVMVWRDAKGQPLGGKVRIGSYVSMASGVTILNGGNHRPDWVSTYPIRVALNLPGRDADGHPASKGDVVIGHDVWIGTDALILSGSTIGDGAVIGARAVVAGNIRPYAIVVGNPARETRRRFTDTQVAALQRIKWWDWAPDRVREEVADLCSENVEAFIRKHEGLSGSSQSDLTQPASDSDSSARE